MPESNEGSPDVWDRIGFVISSEYRMRVLGHLAEGPATPSSIASDTGISISHVSRALNTLSERDLVELLVSKDTKKGRIYGITSQGETLWERIENEGLVE